ncbi:MAG: hypothetical protein IT383_01320, partial [Deltaproteobacteria bacterium]|nr:hypothetical protein [Deltaproteobacteria bacterium]
LVDLRNRVYAPHLRGFLTRDPLGNVDSEGLFAYAAGDPINLRDPWGLGVQGAPAGPQTIGDPPADYEVDWVSPDGTVVRSKKKEDCDAQCREQRRRNEEADRIRSENREEYARLQAERAEAEAARREQRAQAEREKSAWERAKQAAQDAWDELTRRKRDVENRVGEAVEVAVEGGVHRVGLPQTSFGGVKPVGDAARTATGVGIGLAASVLIGAPVEMAFGRLVGAGAAARVIPLEARTDVVLFGGRSGSRVKSLVGPANSIVRGGGERLFVTNERGEVILDITAERAKEIAPGVGATVKRALTEGERAMLDAVLGGPP